MADLTATAAAPALRSGRLPVADYYAELNARFEADLKFSSLLPPGVTPDFAAPKPGENGEPPAKPKGALAAVPIAITPDIDVASKYTTAGSPLLAEVALASESAPAITALTSAGAHLIGQTTSSEFGQGVTASVFGLAKNPYSAFGISGGAASGAAAAVSARIAALALAVETTGEARVPAALTGCVAFRPTHGRYPRGGTLSLSPTLSTVAVIARTVRDVQLCDAVIVAHAAASTAAEAAPAAAETAAAAEGAAEGAAPVEDERAAAVTKIQALSRGFVARRKVSRLGDESAPAPAPAAAGAADKTEAASRIQALARGRADRKKVSQMSTNAAGAASRLAALQSADDAADQVGSGDRKAAEAAAAAALDASAAAAAGTDFDALVGGGSGASGGDTSPSASSLKGRGAFTRDLQGVRIGVPRRSLLFSAGPAAPGGGLHAAVAREVEAALARLAKAGAVLVEVDFDPFTTGAGASGGAAAAGGGGEEGPTDPLLAAGEVATTLLGYEAPRELASYLMTHSAPPPKPKKKEGEEEEPEPEPEDEAEAAARAAAKAAAEAPVPLDTLLPVSKLLDSYRGPAPIKELLSAQLNHRTAVTASAYRSALVYSRPAVKRAFTTLFRRHKLAAIVYPATPVPALPAKGAEGDKVEIEGKGAVDATELYTAHTRPASVAGLPALTVPCGLSKPRAGAPYGSPDAERLPVALEFAGAPGDDERLLALGAAFQRLQALLPDPVVVRKWKEGLSHA